MASTSTSQLPPWRTIFIESCIATAALKFGTFTLKSGRQSPYFFNAGLFHRADLLNAISTAFAHTLASTDFSFDVLFGPAYKGIPLVVSSVDKLAQIDTQRFGGVSYSFNRKEAKEHGEGGNIVGAGLKGRKVVIVDDVITAGTAIREAVDIIKKEGGELVGIVVAFDRQERLEEGSGASAIGQVKKEYGIPVIAILTLDDLVEYLRGTGSEEDMKRLEEYREKYQAKD
jgi:orotate phosphoribosyltransferase